MSEYGIYDGWLIEFIDRHTCGAGGSMGHEPNCGMDPVLRLKGWDDVEEFDLDMYSAIHAGDPLW